MTLQEWWQNGLARLAKIHLFQKSTDQPPLSRVTKTFTALTEKGIALIKPEPVYLEIGPSTLRALQDNEGLEVPLERLNNGRLTASSRQEAVTRLQGFLKRKKWQLPAVASCALGSSGISLRRITLPAAARDEWRQLLSLQIEAEFPLGPDDLAWGYLPLEGQLKTAGSAKREFLVMAVRKDVLEEYANLLLDCGMRPVFTPAGLARSHLCPQPIGSCSILDVDRKHSEWVAFESNVPAALRILPWGTDHFAAGEKSLDMVAQSIRQRATSQTLFLTGTNGDDHQLVTEIARRMGEGMECHRVETDSGPGRSAAILGLKKWAEMNGGMPPLILQARPRQTAGKFEWSNPVLRQRAVAAVVLLLVLLTLPYARAFLLKPFLSRKVAAIESQQGRLAVIDREAKFLQYLKENQPPYLDALYLFANAAPSGTSLDSVKMNRRGQVSLSGSMRGFQQVVEFRSKLIKSGFFSNVSVEQQEPVRNQQKVNVRIVAQWKPAAARALLRIGPTAAEIQKAKAGHNPSSHHHSSAPGGKPIMNPHGPVPPHSPGH